MEIFECANQTVAYVKLLGRSTGTLALVRMLIGKKLKPCISENFHTWSAPAVFKPCWRVQKPKKGADRRLYPAGHETMLQVNIKEDLD